MTSPSNSPESSKSPFFVDQTVHDAAGPSAFPASRSAGSEQSAHVAKPPLSESELFENEWIRYAGHLPRRGGGGYAHGPIDLAWRFWQARAALASAASPLRSWQTIDSAPKDGTRVLLYHPAYKRSFYSRDDAPRWWVDRWTEAAWYQAAPDAQPTHWMPLPTPPADVDAGKQERTK